MLAMLSAPEPVIDHPGSVSTHSALQPSIQSVLHTAIIQYKSRSSHDRSINTRFYTMAVQTPSIRNHQAVRTTRRISRVRTRRPSGKILKIKPSLSGTISRHPSHDPFV
ncbi:hypothetical protein YC2023_066189 [Brassica napus]